MNRARPWRGAPIFDVLLLAQRTLLAFILALPTFLNVMLVLGEWAKRRVPRRLSWTRLPVPRYVTDN